MQFTMCQRAKESSIHKWTLHFCNRCLCIFVFPCTWIFVLGIDPAPSNMCIGWKCLPSSLGMGGGCLPGPGMIASHVQVHLTNSHGFLESQQLSYQPVGLSLKMLQFLSSNRKPR